MSDTQGELVEDAVGPPPDEAAPSFVGRTFARWRQAIWEIAASSRFPFVGSSDPDLDGGQLDRLRSELWACVEARGGEASARARAAGVASTYLALSSIGRVRFFRILGEEFGVDQAWVGREIEAVTAAREEKDRLRAERRLREALIPPSMRLLTQFNALPNGLQFLIDMRATLLNAKAGDPALEAFDSDFRNLLASWFDVGFLTRRRLTWDSPASLLEKIIAYEAVHEIGSWSDLRYRLDGPRRCYAFFHPSLPQEPLIFVQVALTDGLAGEIKSLLDERGSEVDAETANTAIFYSITNTLEGLRGISFGSFLIKQVVDDLAHDLPNLKFFATLSPLPGFVGWLVEQSEDSLFTAKEREALRSKSDAPLAEIVHGAPWLAGERSRNAELGGVLEEPLTRAAARYLVSRSERSGKPLDPVARFHLGNGARIERLNWAADDSPLRIRQSAGLMVNYLYHRPEIEANHEAYASKGIITVSPQIADWLKKGSDDERVRIGRRSGSRGLVIRRS
jgi:malonyl-CoA decarboxylase